MKIDIAHILAESDEIAKNDIVSTFLGNFVKKTHKAHYLLRTVRICDISKVYTGSGTIFGIGLYYCPDIDEVYYKVFGIDIDLKSYFATAPFARNEPPDLYSSRVFEDDDNFRAFANQFNLLKKVVERELGHTINEFSLLKALYDKSTLAFGRTFEKQLGTNSNHSRLSIIEGLAHSVGNVNTLDINFTAIGEAACYFTLNGLTSDFHQAFREIIDEIKTIQNHQEIEEFRALISIAPNPEEVATSVVSIDSTDYLSGTEFERLVGRILQKDGFSIFYTASVGDQGVDLVAQKDGMKLAVQAKRYAGKVTNSAIQEVVAGKAHYLCDKALVVTNNYFTPSAISLSRSNEVLLWDRDLLEKKIIKLNDSP